MTFNKEQLNALYPAEVHFLSSQHDVIRSAPSWLTEQVIEIYQSATGRKMNYSRGCSACVLNIYKTIGKLYLADKAEQEQKSTVNIETKPKKSRKKNG